uniref:Uncharacterized protein n=1 Tax=Romanomermis culicivorax TaxID=13658 RepID=A0A915JKF0_ROMCU
MEAEVVRILIENIQTKTPHLDSSSGADLPLKHRHDVKNAPTLSCMNKLTSKFLHLHRIEIPNFVIDQYARAVFETAGILATKDDHTVCIDTAAFLDGHAGGHNRIRRLDQILLKDSKINSLSKGFRHTSLLFLENRVSITCSHTPERKWNGDTKCAKKLGQPEVTRFDSNSILRDKREINRQKTIVRSDVNVAADVAEFPRTPGMGHESTKIGHGHEALYSVCCTKFHCVPSSSNQWMQDRAAISDTMAGWFGSGKSLGDHSQWNGMGGDQMLNDIARIIEIDFLISNKTTFVETPTAASLISNLNFESVKFPVYHRKTIFCGGGFWNKLGKSSIIIP